jgi:arginyl-tRNA synthetase
MFHSLLQSRVQAAVRAVLPEADLALVQVRAAGEAKFGDYQCSALMAIAKSRRMNPRQLATDVVKQLDVSEWCEPVEIAGPGFLNFRLMPTAIAGALKGAVTGQHLFFAKAAQPRTVVIDFSSPNVAKPMHIGHIRSTVLGACLVKILRLLGHHVVSDNHIGDWGTQFGMLIAVWKILDYGSV